MKKKTWLKVVSVGVLALGLYGCTKAEDSTVPNKKVDVVSKVDDVHAKDFFLKSVEQFGKANSMKFTTDNKQTFKFKENELSGSFTKVAEFSKEPLVAHVTTKTNISPIGKYTTEMYWKDGYHYHAFENETTEKKWNKVKPGTSYFNDDYYFVEDMLNTFKENSDAFEVTEKGDSYRFKFKANNKADIDKYEHITTWLFNTETTEVRKMNLLFSFDKKTHEIQSIDYTFDLSGVSLEEKGEKGDVTVKAKLKISDIDNVTIELPKEVADGAVELEVEKPVMEEESEDN